MSEAAYKAALMMVWPVLALLVVFMVGLAMFAGWFLIPFGRAEEKPDGSWSLKFGEDDPS